MAQDVRLLSYSSSSFPSSSSSSLPPMCLEFFGTVFIDLTSALVSEMSLGTWIHTVSGKQNFEHFVWDHPQKREASLTAPILEICTLLFSTVTFLLMMVSKCYRARMSPETSTDLDWILKQSALRGQKRKRGWTGEQAGMDSPCCQL